MIGSSMMFKLTILCVCVAAVSASIFSSNKCVRVPDNLCAVVYDDGGCNGWKLDIQEGEIMFKWWDPVYYWYRNDIEHVSVRAGCSFTGFDDSSLNGESMTIRAGNKDRHVELNNEDEFEDFDEAIQSISCSCRR
eukprot:GFUD01048233.1.p1 GENE.GFUD01048233.1~~GFUD01048233.1.p1  ORF type:complete len:135 (-),score=37.11 GFUD01048233.1:158-562(-)